MIKSLLKRHYFEKTLLSSGHHQIRHQQMSMQSEYSPQQIESQVQADWAKHQVFKATQDDSKPKFYCLSMLPYPSGKLHMGHVRNYTIGDVIARYQRMQGNNVLQPMGWDSFGMPAENAAIKQGAAPAKWTHENIKDMRGELERLGFGYDWTREVTTCEPEYYRWEQWFFTRLIKKGLAYKKISAVNWCPTDQTVLANEQVVDGCCWRCDTPVERKDMSQWFLKITAYAEELLADLDKLEGWPEQVKVMQRNWIGRSEGLEIAFEVVDDQASTPLSKTALKVYTTRPDTLMGATYLAIAASHPLAQQASQQSLNPQQAQLAEFIESCKQVSTAEADVATMEKRGVPTGLQAIHPVTGEHLPIWCANFVLMEYGTGAVMSVPAHDERDHAFALTYDLPIKQVILPDATLETDVQAKAFTGKGRLVNSGNFDGLDFKAAFEAIAQYLEKKGAARRQVNYRLRDWGVSRQRYWGAPIPAMTTEAGEVVSVADADLPVRLPTDVDLQGASTQDADAGLTQHPLKQHPDFAPREQDGRTLYPETDTFDTFMESSWYYARYCSPHSDNAMLDSQEANYWLPVDQYVGGIEHAVMHLLYARFFHKLMRDAGLVDSDEPFKNLLCQGMVLSEAYYRVASDGSKEWISPEAVELARDDKGQVLTAKHRQSGEELLSAGVSKMSKSKNNGVEPMPVVERYGADTIRLYSMFAAPPEMSLEWTDSGMQGAYKFLNRLWRFAYELNTEEGINTVTLPLSSELTQALTDDLKAVRLKTHSTIQKVREDVGRRYHFNTAIAAIMELLNQVQKLDLTAGEYTQKVAFEALDAMVRMLSPIAPHISQALWQNMQYEGWVLDATWPEVDESALVRDQLEWVVQVNGKVRARMLLPAAAADEVEVLAQQEPNVQRFLEGKTVRKVIIVPGKLVNIVVG